MARKVLDVTITEEGRDKGKVFQITELPASESEEWAVTLFLALAKSGIEVPEDVFDSGMAGIAVLGLRALNGLSIYDAKPLLAKMFTCVKIIPDPSKPLVVRALIEDDIEEVKTRMLLRKEIFMLHVNFSIAAANSQ